MQSNSGCKFNPLSTAHVYKDSVCCHCGDKAVTSKGRGKITNVLSNDMPDSETDTMFNDRTRNEKSKSVYAAKCPGKPPFDNLTVAGLMGAFEMQGRMMVLQMKVEGMRATNAACAMAGHYPDYREQDFKNMADNMFMIVQQFHVMKKVQGFE